MGINFIKTGAEAAKLADHDKTLQAARKEEMNKAFRFFLKQGEERKILFVDGEIDQSTGGLLPARVYEHKTNVQGKWRNYVCPKETDPGAGHSCPFCESGDQPRSRQPAHHHRPDPDAERGQEEDVPVHAQAVRLQANVYEVLNSNAKEFGGLAGHVFKVKRVGEKSERVGDVYIHLNAVTDTAKAKQQFMRSFEMKDKDGKKVMKTECLYEPLDYNKELTYKSAEDLAKLGVASPKSSYPSTPPALRRWTWRTSCPTPTSTQSRCKSVGWGGRASCLPGTGEGSGSGPLHPFSWRISALRAASTHRDPRLCRLPLQ
jgi:hypothetical protein